MFKKILKIVKDDLSELEIITSHYYIDDEQEEFDSHVYPNIQYYHELENLKKYVGEPIIINGYGKPISNLTIKDIIELDFKDLDDDENSEIYPHKLLLSDGNEENLGSVAWIALNNEIKSDYYQKLAIPDNPVSLDNPTIIYRNQVIFDKYVEEYKKIKNGGSKEALRIFLGLDNPEKK